MDSVCDRISCKAYRKGMPNHCAALDEVYINDNHCPFFKTEDQWTKEYLYLRSRNHVITEVSFDKCRKALRGD